MAATYTDNGTNTPNGSHLEFTYTFPVLQTEDVKVALNGTPQATTKYAVSLSPAKITFNNSNVDSTVQESTGAPKTGVDVRVYRETTVGDTNGNEKPKAVFASGSSIRATDLNNNQEQALYGIQELQNQKEWFNEITLPDNAKIKLGNSAGDGEIYWDSQGTFGINSLKINASKWIYYNVSTGQGHEFQVNDTKVLEIEGDKIEVSQHIKPTTNNAVDLGSDSNEFKDIWIDGTAYLDTVDIDAGAIDGTTIGANDAAAGTFTNLTATGNVDLGDAATDSITPTGRFDAHIIPLTDGSIDLGASGVEFKDLYIDGVAYVDEIRLDDDQKIKFGTGVDSEIYHSGTVLNLYSNDDLLIDADGDNLDLKSDGNMTFSVGSSTRFQLNHTQSSILAVWPVSPGVDDTYDLGSSSLKWKDIYVENIKGGAIVTAGTSSDDDKKVYSVKRTEDLFLRQDSTETLASNVAWASNDTTVASTGAIDARIRSLVTDVGGFRPIASEAAFPTTNPDPDDNAGTIVSITALSADRTASGTTLTAGCQTTGGTQVTITGCPNNQVFKSGYGLLVETTSTLNTYTFVRYIADTSSVATVAGKATEIGLLGTAAVVEDLSILGTTAIVSDLDTLADISADITTVAHIEDGTDATDAVQTVAGISSNVTSVAGNATNINAVAGNATNINAVAADATDIGAVAGKATEIGRLGTADAVADMALLGTTACVADMAILGTADVVADMAILGTADVVADMNTLATADVVADMAILATTDVVADLNTLGTADIVSDLNTLGTADAVSDMNTLAAISSNITTVSTNNANVTTCASNISNINSASTHAANALAYRDAAAGILTQTDSIAYNLSDSASTHTAWGDITDVGVTYFANESTNTLLTMSEGSSSYNYGSIT